MKRFRHIGPVDNQEPLAYEYVSAAAHRFIYPPPHTPKDPGGGYSLRQVSAFSGGLAREWCMIWPKSVVDNGYE